MTVCNALKGRSITLNETIWPSSFHAIMSTPLTWIPSMSVVNSRIAERIAVPLPDVAEVAAAEQFCRSPQVGGGFRPAFLGREYRR